MASTIQQSNLPADPELKDVLDLWKRDMFMSLSSHHIGTIQSFNASHQTANATINYKRTYFEFNSVTKLYDPVLVDYPQLIDCPVVILGGGTSTLTFPINPGDECLILFNDRDIDNWFASGGGAGVATPRMHSFSDGIILVGLRSLRRSLSGYDTSRAVLQNSAAKVAVGISKIEISNNLTSLGTLMQTLITDLETFCTACSGSADSTLVSAASALSTTLTALSVQVTGLLQ